MASASGKGPPPGRLWVFAVEYRAIAPRCAPGPPVEALMQTLRILVALMALVLLGGCATFKNTPQQDYVFAVGKNCETPNGRFSIAWVSADGRQWRSNVGGEGYEVQFFNQCMREQFAKNPYRQWFELHKGEYEARR